MKNTFLTINARRAALCVLVCCAASGAVPAQTWLNSAVSGIQAGDAANAESGLPKISPDGRYIAFNSEADNLVVGQVDPDEVDVFLFDRQTSTTSLVSHASDDPLRSSAPGSSQVQAVGGQGAVLFDSTAPHLIAGETAGFFANSFLHFPFNNSNRLISHAAGTSMRSNGECHGRALDQNAQFAVIACTATNLQAGITDSNGQNDLYLYRVGWNDNTLITHTGSSLSTAADVGVDAFGGQVMITGTGHFVAFTSRASNLVAGQSDSNNVDDVFIYEAQTGTLRLVSHIAGSDATSGANGAALVAVDDSHVVFNSSSANHVIGGTDNNGANDVFIYDIATGTITLISHAAGASLTAANGNSVGAPGPSPSIVLLETTASNLSNTLTGTLTRDVLLWYRSSGLFQLVSHAAAAPSVRSNALASAVASDAFGGHVVFESAANDLITGYLPSPGNPSQLYVFDANTASNQLMTHVLAQPTVGSAGEFDPQSVELAPSGTGIVFASADGNLSSSADGNAAMDILVYDRPSNSSSLVSKSAFNRAMSANRVTTPVGVSANGRYVVQNSSATNLSFDQIESDYDSDVFVFDNVTGSETLVSHAIVGFDVLTNVPGNAASAAKAISRDGGWILFSSSATNLVALQNDSNAAVDVFLKDRSGGGLSLVSHASNSTIVTGNAFATAVAVSADGHYVLYDSNASNVVTGITDNNGTSDVFLFDRNTNGSVIVSKANGAMTSGNDLSAAVALSPDGRYVLYRSRATNLIAGFVNLNSGSDDVFLYDRITASSRLISRESGSNVRGANDAVTAIGLSDDGDRIVFYSAAGNLIGTGITTSQANAFIHQVSTSTTRLVSHSTTAENDIPAGISVPIAISGNGAAVLFMSSANAIVSGFVDGNGALTSDVFWYDSATRTNALFSRNIGSSTHSSNREWQNLRINEDASRVTFATLASDVISGINSGSFFRQVYQYDRSTAGISLISHRAGAATEANNDSSGPVMSADGNGVAFASLATNLVAWSDGNAANDTFLAQRSDGFQITPVITGNGTINPSGVQTVATGATITFTLIPGSGQQIASASGCGGALVGNQYTIAPATADCTVSVTFSPQQFTLQYLAGAHGSIAGNALQLVNYAGSGSEVQAIPDVGYQFDHWSDGRPGAGRTDANVIANVSVTAVFTIQRFNLFYTAGIGGTIDGLPSRLFTVDYLDDGPSVTAIPDSGQVFVRWSDNVMTAQRADLDVINHLTVQAEFSAFAQFTVTPVIGLHGSAAPSSPQSVATGATTFFDVTPESGYRVGTVGGCNGNLSGNRYTTGPVSQDCMVTIVFNRTPVALNSALDTTEDGGTYGGMLDANDDDVFTVTLLTLPTKGSLILQPGLQYYYAPDADANGSDSFTYRINDGVQESNVATVNISIAAVNDKPNFTLTPAIVPEHAEGSSGAQTRNDILGAVDFGPADEDANQSIASVQTIKFFDPKSVLSAVSISNAGVLSYTLTGNAGVAKVNVTLIDSGGTANGGSASSDPKQLTISVRNASDLQISNSNGSDSVSPGQAVVYEVLVANAGPYAVSGALLDIPVPTGLSDVLWTCNNVQLSNCTQPSGSGAIDDLVLDLASGGVLRFLVTGNVSAAIGTTLEHTATITMVGDMSEVNPGNNAAADVDPVVAPGALIHRDGFEQTSTLTLPLLPGSTLYQAVGSAGNPL